MRERVQARFGHIGIISNVSFFSSLTSSREGYRAATREPGLQGTLVPTSEKAQQTHVGLQGLGKSTHRDLHTICPDVYMPTKLINCSIKWVLFHFENIYFHNEKYIS